MNTKKLLIGSFYAAALSICAFQAYAQEQRPSYGAQVTVDQAKKLAAGALAEAKKNNWNVAIAIVDTSGALVYYERMEDAQSASPGIAIEKARTSAMFRRPTRAFQDAINKAGSTATLGLPGATPIAGGLPIVLGGKIGGAIGVSGVTADQDEQIARAGLDSMK
ncbi:MAG TPA: heme-binding protein [Burkholderiales bacterium]|nr:heme-binding protein [Burkholderiales bacterium]